MDQGDFVHGETDRPAVMIYYSFQLHMRKLLNDIQKELYQESKSHSIAYVPILWRYNSCLLLLRGRQFQARHTRYKPLQRLQYYDQ